MKRIALRATIAVVLALLLVVGPAAPAEASKPVKSITVSIDSVTPGGIVYSYAWENYRAYTVERTIFDNTASTRVYRYYYNMGRGTRSGSGTVTAALAADPLHTYTLTMTLFNRKGGAIATASDMWQPGQ